MQISFFVPRCTPDNSHGRYVIELASRLGLEHGVTVFAGAFWAPLRSTVECRLIPVPNRPAVARLAILWTASLVATRRKTEIVHIQGADAPVGNVVTAHCCNAAMQISVDGKSSLTRKLNYALGSRVERYCFTRSPTRTVIAVSEKVKAEIETFYGVEPKKIVVIPLGVDAGVFHPGTRGLFRQMVRAGLSIEPDDFVLSFVGGDYRLKGLTTLLGALKQLPLHVKAITVGVEPDAALRHMVAEGRLEDRVKFVGRTPEPSRYYAAADCFVLPTRYDTFSLATLEAMASGLPVVVTRAAGVSELLTDGLDSIILQDPADVVQLARQLDRLMTDDRLRKSLGEEARKSAERLSWEKVAERTLAVYRQLS
jgi:glycosyltransferase involved in cell wall biosynthesis